ncbi:hypothetical protein BDW66DRAFT_144807 [Aspergillus desertorum]
MPFPLYHLDLYQSNITVDSTFQVHGAINWEGACTVPGGLVQPPLFLRVLPRAMDDPDIILQMGSQRIETPYSSWQRQ